MEFRGKFLDIHKPRIDLVMHASVHAEEGFLFDGWDPGPHLPTLGVSLDVTIARMVYLRPYLSWGWVQSSEEDPRRAKPFFGITATGTM